MIEKILILLLTIATGFVTFLIIQVISTGDANNLLIMIPVILVLILLNLAGGDK